ncbi:MAG: hypothetical protein RL693_2172 [Verrucomicrobiota bacterium]|jgi:hypothetical protein
MHTHIPPSIRVLLLTAFGVLVAQSANAVDLVTNGKPVADIVIAADAIKATRTSAEELQRHLLAMSGATLAIVDKPGDAANHIYVGASEHTQKLGINIDDVKFDGYKIIAKDHHVVLIGRDVFHSLNHFGKYIDREHRISQEAWEKMTGHKWRTPTFYDEGGYSKVCGFHLKDATGTLYAVFGLLEQLGMRWYMPDEELGLIRPHHDNISITPQSVKKEPEFGQRRFADNQPGTYRQEMMWYKSMGVGTSKVIPLYHAVGRLTYFGKEADPAYFGIINGKPGYQSPKLNSEKLRTDFITSLDFTRQLYPGIEYDSLGQPDGWSTIDSADAAAGWEQAERGIYGNFSNYAWDFNLDIVKRISAKLPERKFTVMAYSGTTMPPTTMDKIPDSVLVGLMQHSTAWMLPPWNGDLELRNEWLKRMKDGREQLLIMDHYLEQAVIRNAPPVPVFFTKIMQANLKAAYDHVAGYDIEVPWIPSNETKPDATNNLRRPGLSHLMIYLHARMMWDRDLDLNAVLDEYYRLFFGPAATEMKQFHEFGEAVWSRPEAREVTGNGGFLKQADIDQFFALLTAAKAKTGDSIYTKRIALLEAEMQPLKGLFANLQRSNGTINGYYAKHPHKIDGDLTKPFWTDPEGRVFMPLSEMFTGETPHHIATNVAFRWLPDESGLVVGIECIEPKMDKLRAACKERDSYAIFDDDTVEIRLETAKGIRPLIVINPNATVLDECITTRSEDLASFYTVKNIAVKKAADRWFVEALIEVKPIEGEVPSKAYPWGVNICRQRMAGNTPEFYMLFPSGTQFKDPKAMGNLIMRR